MGHGKIRGAVSGGEGARRDVDPVRERVRQTAGAGSRELGTHFESWNEVPSFTMKGWSRPARIRFSESMCSTCCKRITSAFFSCLIAQTVPAD